MGGSPRPSPRMCVCSGIPFRLLFCPAPAVSILLLSCFCRVHPSSVLLPCCVYPSSVLLLPCLSFCFALPLVRSQFLLLLQEMEFHHWKTGMPQDFRYEPQSSNHQNGMDQPIIKDGGAPCGSKYANTTYGLHVWQDLYTAAGVQVLCFLTVV